jgi:hypothetical protein
METNNKLLTEADLIVGNRFECIEEVPSYCFYKDNVYECKLGGTINSAFNNQIALEMELLNRHFKLLPPTQEESPYKDKINKIVDDAFEKAKVKAQEESVNGEDEEDEMKLLSDSERESEIAKFKAYPFEVRPGKVEDEIDHAKREIYKRGFKEGFEMANQKTLSTQQENDRLKDELNKYKLAHSLYANPCGFCGQIKCICHQPLI